MDPRALSEDAWRFLRDRHLATLTTLRPDGSPHVVAVGFTCDVDSDGECPVARIITSEGSQKVRNIDAGGLVARAAVAQVDGPHWLSLEGPATVRRDAAAIADAVRRYGDRYRTPRENPERVVIEIRVERVLGRAAAS